MSSSDSVVIVGSGLAGYNVARELRKLDANVPITVISRDHAGFYSKPMLSNALAGKKTAATLVMKAADKIGAEINAKVLPHSAVERIDTAARTLLLNDGQTLPYRDVVLALGADPIRLPLQGDAADTVLSVNDLDDFARFAEALDHPDGVKRVAMPKLVVICPKCGSSHTELTSQFGSTPCKALYKCLDCREPFDYFKCH